MTESPLVRRFASAAYRLRWPATLASLGLVAFLFITGLGQVKRFSAQVASLADVPEAEPRPQVFDPRSDIWFDPMDSALGAYHALEDRFVAEDVLFVAFEVPEGERGDWGAFEPAALQKVAEWTAKLEQIPYVRNVRSLTANPWIRWGEVAPGEEGLLVSDLFEQAPGSYGQDARLQRMIAVLGAERSATLVGAARVRAALGPQARFEDYQGEPRLLRGIVSEDGRATALQVQVLRPRVEAQTLDRVFGQGRSLARDVGPVIHKSVQHGDVVATIEQMIEAETDYEMHLTGTPVLERHFQQVGKADMRFVGLMFLAIALALLVIYRRASGATLPLLVVMSTILGMMGSIWVVGDLLNNLTAVTPTVVTAVGVADTVHLVSAYFLLRPGFDDRRALITEVLSRNALPVLLTSVTTAVGFFSLATSAIIPVRQFGITAGVGTLLAYLLSMTVVPALLSLLPVRRPATPAGAGAGSGQGEAPASPTGGGRAPLTDRLVDFIMARRTAVLWLTAGLFAFAAFGMSKVQFATDLRLMFAKGDRVSGDIYWWDNHMGGIGDLELLFYGPPLQDDADAQRARSQRSEALLLRRSEAGALSEEERRELAALQAADADHARRRIAVSAAFLSQLDAFQRRLQEEARMEGSALRTLSRFDSALDVLRKMHQVQNENRADAYRVPTDADVSSEARSARIGYDDILEEAVYIPAQSADTLIAQYYLQYENGARPSENLANLITADRRGVRMTIRLGTAPTVTTLRAFERVEEIAKQQFPTLAGSEDEVASGAALSTMTMTGKQYMFTNMFRRFSDTMVKSLIIALSAITLLIMLVFRSVRLGLISLVPNVLPILLPMAVLGLLGVQIDGPSVVVASVALGVCVDDTIHLFSKFRHFQSQGFAPPVALRLAFAQVGGALTLTTVVLVLGFSMLTLGTFRPNIVTGYLGASMIGLAWLADFVLTPALLSLLGPVTETTALASDGSAQLDLHPPGAQQTAAE